MLLVFVPILKKKIMKKIKIFQWTYITKIVSIWLWRVLYAGKKHDADKKTTTQEPNAPKVNIHLRKISEHVIMIFFADVPS